MAEFNIVIGNIDKKLRELIFGDEQIIVLSDQLDMFDILVFTGLFSSKGQARKNWTRTGREIPTGFTDIRDIGKLHHRLTIWNEETPEKKNFTFRITSNGDTFNETQYGITFDQATHLKDQFDVLGIKVHNIWEYGLGEISEDRSMIYSKKKGWI